MVHRNDLGRGPLFPAGAVVLEAEHLVDRVEFLVDRVGVLIPVVAPVGCRMVLEGLRVQDL